MINFVLGLYVKNNKPILFLAIILNLFVLTYYKYLDFFLSFLNFNINTINNIYLPLGISFFTFQQIIYIFDRYNGQIKENFLSKYFLFIIFFPQLIAGPLLRYNSFYNNFNLVEKFKKINIFLIIISIALFKKIFLANNLGLISDNSFESIDKLTFIDAWISAISFHFEIYFDFSAYCDFAVATGYLFGYKIPINFNSPYKKKVL